LKYNELAKFHHSVRHWYVPKKHPTHGNWVTTQRAQYKKWKEGEKSRLTQDRVDRLNAIGFQWTYCGLGGVPEKYAGVPGLGKWVTNQILYHKYFLKGKTIGGMTQDRIDSSESIGFCWSAKRGRPFERRRLNVESVVDL